MARRRKSSKGGGFVGVIAVVGFIAVSFVIQFVQQYYAAILTVLGLAGIGWLVITLVRWRRRRRSSEMAVTASAPAFSSNSTFPAQQPWGASKDALEPSWSSRTPRHSTGGKVESQLNDNYSTPDVRIRPLVDSARAPIRAGGLYTGPPRWIAPGEAVTIGGVTVTGGMFYLGAPSSSSDTQPCFLDPGLKVAKTRSPKADPPTYYPSYSKITPSQRRGFLQWMANGRSDPEENLSLVFLFFYGLEHRIFKEGVTADAPKLIAEVERLLSIYGRSKSFLYYAKHFIAYARASIRNFSEPDIDLGTVPKEMPLDIKIYLGQKLVVGRAIQAGDALIWAISSPVAWRKRWPVDQKDVFEHLWQTRFSSRFPDGLRVRAPKEQINSVYSPASRSFRGEIIGTFGNVPDPSVDTLTPATLKEIVDECWTDGGSYASSTTRTGSQPTLSAAVLLPVDVWIKRNEMLLKALADRLAAAGTGSVVLPIADIFKMAEMSVSVAPKMLLMVLKRLSEGLWTLGVGLEPDGNYADADIGVSSPACLFRLPAAYHGRAYCVPVNMGARAVTDVAILSALAADNDVPGTRARIAIAVSDGTEADDLERARLAAYASVSKPSPERQSRLLRSIAQFSTRLRETAARAAIVGATTAKHMPVQVVRHLEKVHKALNLPTDAMYGALHRFPEDEPAPIAALNPVDAGFEAIRRELSELVAPPVPANGFAIDQARLARARDDTQAVFKVLSDVFSETTASAVVAPAAPTLMPAKSPVAVITPFEGLDASHGALLSAVVDAGALPKSEFEQLAKSMKMFSDGALDHINEWAFDRFERPVIEDGEAVTIAPHLVERVKQMRRDQA